LDSWTKGQEIVLSRFDDYYAGPARVDKLIFKVIKEELVALLAFGRGEVDVVPIRDLAAYKAMVGHEEWLLPVLREWNETAAQRRPRTSRTELCSR
jgi:ABC-type transport system substrate-binding protein